MIISASRRTDIPAYYSEWMMNRLSEGYVLVRNPMNAHQIWKISLSPDVVDGIVFWTKNPEPMLKRLKELDRWPFYFQFTLTAYGPEVETHLPSKNKVIIPAFQWLSKEIGREKVVWRYDPIFFNDRYTMDYHCRYFKVLAAKLGDYTEKCTVSFLDFYRSTVRNMRTLNVVHETKAQQMELMARFAEIAGTYGFDIDTCAEEIDLGELGIGHARCIDKERLERIGKYRLSVKKDVNQRPACGCVQSIDIGTYHTCENGCLYCYANDRYDTAVRNARSHHPASPLLFGEIGPDDIIKERKIVSCKEYQMTLFDDGSIWDKEENMATFICYEKCSTCRKAEKWLQDKGISYEKRPIREENPTAEELRVWKEKSGLPLKRFFNTSGQLYRSMGLKDRLKDMTEDEQIQLLASDGMLVKRPILLSGEHVLVGFREAQWQEEIFK